MENQFRISRRMLQKQSNYHLGNNDQPHLGGEDVSIDSKMFRVQKYTLTFPEVSRPLAIVISLDFFWYSSVLVFSSFLNIFILFCGK